MEEQIQELKDIIQDYENITEEQQEEIEVLKDKLSDVFDYADSIIKLQ